MSAPTITSVSPLNNESDVVLGTQVVVTFDQVIDPATVTPSTFSLVGPGQTQILTPTQLLASDPSILTGREYVPGVVTVVTVSSVSQVTFNPSRPLQPNVTYQVTVAGIDGVLSSDGVKNLGGEGMATSTRWSFVTGDLNISQPPTPSPLPSQVGRIDPNQIVVIPRKVIGNDLAQEIDIIFPGPIATGSFSLSDLLMSIEPILGDPSVTPPSGLTATAQVNGNKITILITGW